MTKLKNSIHLATLPSLLMTLKVSGTALMDIVKTVWTKSAELNLVTEAPPLPVPSPVVRERTEAYLRLLNRRPDIAAAAKVPASFVSSLLEWDKGLVQTDQGLLLIAQRADSSMKLLAAGLSAVMSDVWQGVATVTANESLGQERRDYINGLWSDARALIAQPAAAMKARLKKSKKNTGALKAQITQNEQQRQLIAKRAAVLAAAKK